MKNLKPDSKSEENKKSKGPGKSKSIIVINSVPGEAEIRDKANEIYQQRIERGENGTAESDWLEAQKYFRDSEN